MNSDAWENRGRHVNGELPFLAQYSFTAAVQMISDCVEIQNIFLTSDKVLNVL